MISTVVLQKRKTLKMLLRYLLYHIIEIDIRLKSSVFEGTYHVLVITLQGLYSV